VTATSTGARGRRLLWRLLERVVYPPPLAVDDEYGVYLSNSESSIVLLQPRTTTGVRAYDYEGKSNKWFGNAISGVEDHGFDLEGPTTDTANANTISGRALTAFNRG